MTSSEGQQAAPSLPDSQGSTKPRVIPQSQLVILRESELDCDLATAIQRIREDENTTSSRILIVGPEEGAESEAELVEELPLPQLPMSIGQVARTGAYRALERAGERLIPKVQSMDCLFDEASKAVEDLEEASQEGTLARLQGRLRVVRDVLQWLQATSQDLRDEVAGLHAGFQLVDVFDLLSEIQAQVESFFPGLRVNVAPPVGDTHCWGRADALTEGLFLGLVIASHRIGGRGAVNVEIGTAGDRLAVRIVGLGEPVEVEVPEQLLRFREIVVDLHRGRIAPDSLGPFGSGMSIELPTGPAST